MMFLIVKTISEGSEGKSTFKVSHSVRFVWCVRGSMGVPDDRVVCVVKISFICHGSLLL